MEPIICDECGEEVDHVSDCNGFDLCKNCVREYEDAVECDRQMRKDFRAAVL